MYAISCAFSMKLIGTSTAPSRASANRSAANACELRERMATRSPAVRPRSISPFASLLQVSSNSRYVHFVSPKQTAILSGRRAAVRRGRSPIVCCRILATSMGRYYESFSACSIARRAPRVGIGFHAAVVVEQHRIARGGGVGRPLRQLGRVWIARPRKRDPRRARLVGQRIRLGHFRDQRSGDLDVVEHELNLDGVRRSHVSAAFRCFPVVAIRKRRRTR